MTTTPPAQRLDPQATVLRAVGLRRSFGGIVAVNDVDLRLSDGEILGLVGPNGAGKSTLVDLIGGQQPADSGHVDLRDKRLPVGAAKRARAGIARTYQHPRLALDLTARENILVGALGRYLGSIPQMALQLVRSAIRPATDELDQEAAEYAARLGLPDIDRECGALTLGQMRLAEFARALMQRPNVLLADEPFSGVDERGAERIAQAMRQMGCGAILIDHNIDLVAKLADRVVLLDRGAVVFEGEPEACLASHQMEEVYFGL